MQTRKEKYDMLSVVGPTACGKTSLAVDLAMAIDGAEIISADSRQVYRGMDIGTGKDIAEYTRGGVTVPVHLLDIVDAGYKYNVFEFQKDFLAAYENIKSRSGFPLMCGGSGLYVESVLKGYRLLPVPENTQLRERLEQYSLEELTGILAAYKTLHNNTDTDNKNSATQQLMRAEILSGITTISATPKAIPAARDTNNPTDSLPVRRENSILTKPQKVYNINTENTAKAIVAYKNSLDA